MKTIPMVVLIFSVSCAAPEGKGLKATERSTGAKVRFDVSKRPLPDIPLPNDFATRFDATSPTKRRVNASMVAPTKWEQATRAELDALDGWGTYQALSVSFESPLDLHNMVKRHQGDNYDSRDDAILLIDVTRNSPTFCQSVPLDLGEGNNPIVLEQPSYFPNDRPGDNLLFEDREEDLNRNGVLDLGEDLDMDGVLDHPNVLAPGDSTFKVMSWYERETNTLIAKPVLPLRENTTYAAVITKRMVDETGRPVRSPFAYINHTSQTEALSPLSECLPQFGLSLEDVGFTWSYSTQSITRDFKVIRDGLYGFGPMKRLATEFPGEIEKLLPLRDQIPSAAVNVRIVSGEMFRSTAIDLLKAQSGGMLDASLQAIAESQKYIDFHAVFTFESPQFFRRVDSEGNALPLYKQTFDLNPTTGAAFTRPEKITVWVVVPKRLPTSKPGPLPTVILGHGYTGNKLDPLFYGGFLARFGLASIGMENVSHGIGLDETTAEFARALLAGKGLGPMFDALVVSDRASDQNGDGVKDSAADFWTSYVAHTRDVVRQSAIDYMQLIRIVRGFDGTRTWNYDGNKDGSKDLAGDFNADGVVDIGGSASVNILGGSLGGIMSTLLAGLEPHIDVAVPISGASGLLDVGSRSIQGGVREAVVLRTMGPLLIGCHASANGCEAAPSAQTKYELWQYLPDLNSMAKIKVATIPGALNEGDTAVLSNIFNGEKRCARVGTNGNFRVAVPSDINNEWILDVFRGPLPAKERDGCEVPSDLLPAFTANRFEFKFKFQGSEHEAGESLKALGDGFGLRRQSPEYRKFLSLAQMAVDKGDPINFLSNIERHDVLRYATGEEVSTRMMVVNVIGDMNVPVAAGAAIARGAGMIDLKAIDARYGKTPNRVLIDTGTLEAVERVGRFKNSRGEFVHMDIDHLSKLSGDGTQDLFDVPRLDPPLRLVKPSARVGGVTGVLFPMAVPTGRHGFDTPNPSLPFDLGSVMMNMLGRYVETGGAELPLEGCLEKGTCGFLHP
jgi:hypothetical protein